VLLIAGAIVALSRLQVHVLKERLIATTSEREQLVETQNDLSSGVVEGFDVVRRRILQAAMKLVPEAQAAALIEARDRGQTVCAHAVGERFEAYRGVVLERVPAIIADALASGKVLSLRESERGLHPSDTSAIAVAIPIDGGDRAILYVASSRSEAWNRETEQALDHLANLAAPAYRLAKDREFLRDRAIVDALSGCISQVAFVERVVEEISRASAAERISLVYIDADHFKHWNDNYGHNSGDKLIERLGRLYRAHTLSPLDFVGRTGGDEFCIAFLGCDKTAAIRRAVELLEAIEQEDRSDIIPAGKERMIDITGSIGVATFPVDANAGVDLVKAADAAMYHSKHNGRNRVSYQNGKEIVSVSDGDRAELLREQRRDAVNRPWGRRNLRVAGDE
jgi:diguanylate cyclase (GGDEF)-like protein